MADLTPQKSSRHQRPARSPEQRELQMMALAIDLSEERLRNGTASSAEIVYWLKQASPQAILERRNIEMQNELLEAKIDAIRSEQKGNADYDRALNAFKGYQPHMDVDEIIEGDFREL